MKHLCTSLAGMLCFLLLSLPAFSQIVSNLPEQDCASALPVCSPIMTVPLTYVGEGQSPNEINGTTSCLNVGERNTVWLHFQPEDSGMICFDIDPVSPMDDYDWAVYNLTNNDCSDIYSTPSLEISCNYSGIPGTTGPNGAVGNQNEPCIPVMPGEFYAIVVSNFTGSVSGFVLDFTASTALIYDSTVVQIDSVSNFPGANGLLVQMNESVLCSQIDNGDFSVTLPNGNPTSILSVTGLNCNGSFTDSILIEFVQPFSPSALLSLTVALTADMVHLCNLDSLGNIITPMNANRLNTAIQMETISLTGGICEGDSIRLFTPFTGDTGFQTVWMPGNIVADELWVDASGGAIYTVSTSFPSLGLQGSAQITISTSAPPTWQSLPDIQSCEDSVQLTLANTFDIYHWSTGDSTDQIWLMTGDEGMISVEVGNWEGCTVKDTFDLSFLEASSVSISASPDTSSASSVLFSITSANVDSLLWDFGDGNTGIGPEILHTYTSSGSYEVIVTAYGPCGPVSDTMQITIATTDIADWQDTGIQSWLTDTDLHLSIEKQGIYEVSLWSVDGRRIWQQEDVLSGVHIRTIPNLAKGMYVVQLASRQGQIVYVNKLVRW